MLKKVSQKVIKNALLETPSFFVYVMTVRVQIAEAEKLTGRIMTKQTVRQKS
nr:hypothetical protein [Bacillus thuringiensis]